MSLADVGFACNIQLTVDTIDGPMEEPMTAPTIDEAAWALAPSATVAMQATATRA